MNITYIVPNYSLVEKIVTYLTQNNNIKYNSNNNYQIINISTLLQKSYIVTYH